MNHAEDESKRLLKELQEAAAQIKSQRDGTLNVRHTINKRTHRIRFENETEDQVTIIIEPQGEQ